MQSNHIATSRGEEPVWLLKEQLGYRSVTKGVNQERALREHVGEMGATDKRKAYQVSSQIDNADLDKCCENKVGVTLEVKKGGQKQGGETRQDRVRRMNKCKLQ